MAEIKSICVFCGASTGNDPQFAEEAARLGELIAHAGIRLIFGGGRVGLMGAIADSALAAGGDVIGVIPSYLKDLEHGHPDVTDLQVVDSMHSRKQRMFELADGFVTLPGGVGTLDETFEIVTWRQLRMHGKPIVIVDIGGYWRRFDALVANAVETGFASPRTRSLYEVVPSVDDVLPTLATLPVEAIDSDSSLF